MRRKIFLRLVHAYGPLLTPSSCTGGIIHVRIGEEDDVNGLSKHESGLEVPDKG